MTCRLKRGGIREAGIVEDQIREKHDEVGKYGTSGASTTAAISDKSPTISARKWLVDCIVVVVVVFCCRRWSYGIAPKMSLLSRLLSGLSETILDDGLATTQEDRRGAMSVVKDSMGPGPCGRDPSPRRVRACCN